ncbi:MAG: efflux RND transporter periplasmic adaptor subunit [Clostridiales Family XIII bacterium]|nr:efflux RND transporter periplasmic adaptor subunit [Clostridiales Family XIII bacterium]
MQAHKTYYLCGALLWAVFSLLLFSGCSNDVQAIETPAKPIVQTESPIRGDISLESEFIGKAESGTQVTVYPEAVGEVRSVFFGAGDIVKAGDVLCALNADKLQNTHANAEVAIRAAENRVKSAAVSLASARQALEDVLYGYESLKDAIPQKTHEQQVAAAEDAIAQAELAKESAEIALRQAQISLAQVNDSMLDYKIVAPISGVIDQCNVDVFSAVSPQTPAYVIAEKEYMTVVFHVPETSLTYLRLGDAITIRKEDAAGKGEITEISYSANAVNRLYAIEARISDSELSLTSESNVKVLLETNHAENALLLPIDAVYYDGGEAYVYRLQDGRAAKTPVEIGMADDEKAQVLSGVTAEDKIITTWHKRLGDGVEVEVAEAKK